MLTVSAINKNSLDCFVDVGLEGRAGNDLEVAYESARGSASY